MHENVAKAYRGMGMEGGIARWYARNTLRDMDEFRKLAVRLSEMLPAGGDILEVAPGPGYLAVELARQSRYRVTGLDISKTFVDIAQRNAAQAKVDVDFRQGNASAMPFAAGSFDLVVCRAAFKNFSEPVKAISEMYRVLKPGGHALIIDLRKDASRESIGEAVRGMRLGRVNALITRLTFRFMLLKRASTRSELERLIAQTKFGPAEIEEGTIGLELSLHRGR